MSNEYGIGGILMRYRKWVSVPVLMVMGGMTLSSLSGRDPRPKEIQECEALMLREDSVAVNEYTRSGAYWRCQDIAREWNRKFE